MRHLLLLCAAILALQACTPQVLPDAPKNPTAVTRTYLHNLGFKGLFASENTHTVYTRADMRREENDFKFSGFVMKHLSSGRADTVIWRADRNKQWRLNIKDKTYTECPLLGCRGGHEAPSRSEQPAQEQKREKPTCPLTVAKNKLSVEPTSETRELNGFKAKRYKVTWELVLQDQKKRKDTSLVAVDVWTTPEDNPRLVSVRAIERRFEQHLRDKAEAALSKAIPAEAMQVITLQLLSGLSPAQRSSIASGVNELSKINGHPVQTHLVWTMGGNACEAQQDAAAKKEEKPAGLDFTNGFGGLIGSAARKGAQNKAEELSAKPVFEYIQELQKSDVEPASDALFSVPPSYKPAAKS